MGSTVLSLRIDGELLDRLRQHAAKRGMSVQDYVVRTLIRDDFDERFTAAVEETEKFYGDSEETEKLYGDSEEEPGQARGGGAPAPPPRPGSHSP
ncbi:hypothetical protein ACFV00_20350, partial [Streptomyces californicus]|uniref:hypothetical protein n=1 Tax=Streptomyces californicus TaxID=67351 RepID=UPI00369328CB